MSLEAMLVLIMAALLVLTNALWAVNTHRLINKLMSRNFFEYKEASLQDEKLKVKSNQTPDVPRDFEDFGSLHEIMP
jgi:hypothetical protein